jgi:hypothetical protein
MLYPALRPQERVGLWSFDVSEVATGALGRYGTVPHAGLGLASAFHRRTLANVTGLATVRDAVPFPSMPGDAR